MDILLKALKMLHIISNKKYQRKKLKTSKNYRLLAKSKYFDRKWYLKMNPDVKKSGVDPVLHYLTEGWKEGRNPSEGFDGNYYMEQHQDVAKANINPLLHFEKFGQKEGRRFIVRAPLVIDFPKDAETIFFVSQDKIKLSHKRIAVFASYNKDGLIEDYVLYYLRGLRKVVDAIVFIADNPVLPKEVDKIKDLVVYAQFERHEEYDFGSYKRGIQYLQKSKLLKKFDELVICNDSCFGPIYPFEKMFEEMEAQKADFWGLTQNQEWQQHLQSYFLVFKKNVFNSCQFKRFFKKVQKELSVRHVIINYEVRLANYLSRHGFNFTSYISYPSEKNVYPRLLSNNLTRVGEYILTQKSPLIKLKYFFEDAFRDDNVTNVLVCLKKINPDLYDLIKAKDREQKLEIEGEEKFSIILPTYNRAFCIQKAIDSALAQSYQNFELIIVDDGSTDETEKLIKRVYRAEIKKEKIKYLKIANGGVCRARNVGLENAKNEWIAYLDSDNMMTPVFLETYLRQIRRNKARNIKVFYACFKRLSSGRVIGNRKFNWNDLYHSNFIDLGVFVHHISVYKDLGGFDINLKRLVDWDIILTFTHKYVPSREAKVVLLYDDIHTASRISTNEDYAEAKKYLHKKHEPIVEKQFIESCYHEVNTWGSQECFVPIAKNKYVQKEGDPLLLAYYLTQFHETEINNINFGKGFTEWTNVAKALPLFEGHYQPQIPMDVGFYNLDNDNTMKRQVELAKMYGVGGFCFYYYWFSGQRLLEKPLFNWLNNKELDLKFCLFWANTPWVSHWMGGSREILMEQNFQFSEIEKFYQDILPFFKDERYIKIENKPLLIVYHPEIFTKELMATAAEKFNHLAKETGFDGVYLCQVGYQENKTELQAYGMDGLVEFPPCKMPVRKAKASGYMNPNFTGKLYSMETFITTRQYLYETDYPVFKGVFPSWDNTPRNCSGAKVYVDCCPKLYEEWLSGCIEWTKKNHSSNRRFVFINAWNEWAEGAHLEPDLKYGYAYLQATRNALERNQS